MIPNGIEIERYAPPGKGQKVPGRVLFIGRPEPRKGLPALLEAFEGLRRRLPDATLVLAGPTPEELQAFASRERRTPEQEPQRRHRARPRVARRQGQGDGRGAGAVRAFERR